MPKLVEIGVDAMFAALRDSEHRALVDLMVSLLRRNAYSLDDFLTGVHSKTDQLEDLRCGLRALWGSYPEPRHIYLCQQKEVSQVFRRMWFATGLAPWCPGIIGPVCPAVRSSSAGSHGV